MVGKNLLIPEKTGTRKEGSPSGIPIRVRGRLMYYMSFGSTNDLCDWIEANPSVNVCSFENRNIRTAFGGVCQPATVLYLPR